jgi:ATP phosphoribosyltransferase regulatory subunit
MLEPLSRIPDGMRYYFGSEARLRRSVEDTVMSVFDGWSYEEITTPSVDYYALFERGMGREEAQRAFRFMDADGRLLALRPDVTSSVARAAATLFADRPRPLRLCYAASVFRQQSKSHAEWRRESKQLGCEYIGLGEETADLEVLAIAAEVFFRLGLDKAYRITLSSVEIFNGVAENLAMDEASREEMRRLIDLKDETELQKFLSTYATSLDERARFSQLTRLSGKRNILNEARHVIKNSRSVAALNELDRLWDVIEALNLTESFEIDLGDVSGLDYYTGLFFKIYVAGAGARVGSGGRYDGLIGSFGRPEPAVGFVLDLDALTDVLVRSSSTTGEDSNGIASKIDDKDLIKKFINATGIREKNNRVSLQIGDSE